jgi:hypothetical protein
VSGDRPPPPEPGGAPPGETPPDPGPRRSELEDAAAGVSRAVGGLLTQLLGEKVTGLPAAQDRPVISEEADAAVERGTEAVGRWLRGAGEALADHPLAPSAALEEAQRIGREPVPPEPGLTPLSIGLRSLARGLFRTTEAALDQVAPRKPRPPGEAPAPADGEGTTASASPPPASPEEPA